MFSKQILVAGALLPSLICGSGLIKRNDSLTTNSTASAGILSSGLGMVYKMKPSFCIKTRLILYLS